jgi:hypothetical protein
VRAASFELAKVPGFKPGASSSSATPANWCPLIDSNDHDRSRRCLKPLRLPIPPRGHWCARRDLNPHGVTRRILSAVRLPVPPRARCLEPPLGFEPSSAPYRGAASPQCFEGKWCRQGQVEQPTSVATRAAACRYPLPASSNPPPKPGRSRLSDLRVEGAPYAQGRHPGRSHRSILADRNSFCRPRSARKTTQRAPAAGRQRRAP